MKARVEYYGKLFEAETVEEVSQMINDYIRSQQEALYNGDSCGECIDIPAIDHEEQHPELEDNAEQASSEAEEQHPELEDNAEQASEAEEQHPELEDNAEQASEAEEQHPELEEKKPSPSLSKQRK